MWEVEHGPRGGDELNIARPGRSLAGHRLRPPLLGSQNRRGHGQGGHGTADLLLGSSIAVSGLAFYTADLFPGWKGNLFTGALAGEHLERLVLEGDTVVAHEKLLSDLGERIRDVRQGPDGALWLLTDSPNGRVIRVTPCKRCAWHRRHRTGQFCATRATQDCTLRRKRSGSADPGAG